MVAVVAMGRNRVIGDGKKLLWHLPGDLPRVKALTMGKPLIMGRRTFESIGKPLGGRGNIVLTRQRDWHAAGVDTAYNIKEAINKAAMWIEGDVARRPEIIIFGGSEIYRLFLPYVTAIDLTEIDLAPEGQATFPLLNNDEWQEVERQSYPADDGTVAHAIVRLERRVVS